MINREKSLTRHVDKTDELYQRERDRLMISPEPDEYGNIRMNYQHFRQFVEQRVTLAYCQGVYRTLGYVN